MGTISSHSSVDLLILPQQSIQRTVFAARSESQRNMGASRATRIPLMRRRLMDTCSNETKVSSMLIREKALDTREILLAAQARAPLEQSHKITVTIAHTKSPRVTHAIPCGHTHLAHTKQAGCACHRLGG